jgi:Arc/MetJ family transcription regulator
MRTTLALDDELVAKAQALTGVTEKSSLVREALKAFVVGELALGNLRQRPMILNALSDFTQVSVARHEGLAVYRAILALRARHRLYQCPSARRRSFDRWGGAVDE